MKVKLPGWYNNSVMGTARHNSVCLLMAMVSRNPNSGDLIEIFHKDDAHWAIYMGDGDVVHLAPAGCSWLNPFRFRSSRKVVKREPLKAMVGSSYYRVNNHLDGQCRPLPVSSILSQAKKMIGADIGNSMGEKNFVTHLRHGVACSMELYKEPKPGDLIEIFHKEGPHWAIYMGDGDIVHLAPPGDGSVKLSPFRGSGKMVKWEPLKDVVGGSRCRVSNHLDGQRSPLPVSSILSQAKEKVGADMGNSVEGKDFVTHLRYGVAYSKEFYEEPHPGDLIEIFRKDDSHWAIYVGDGDVVHLVPPWYSYLNPFQFWSSWKVVKQEPLQGVVGSSPYSVNNHLDDQCLPLPEDEILRRAKEKIGSQVKSVGDMELVTHLRHGVAYGMEELYEEPHPGDPVEIFHKGDTYWAMYVGDGDVVHLAPPWYSWLILLPFWTISKVLKREPLKAVLGRSPYRVNTRQKLPFQPPQFPEDPSPGDLIEISRSDSHHWALYVGDGDVVHLVPHGKRTWTFPGMSRPILSDEAEVKQQPLRDALEDWPFRVNNRLDSECEPLPVSVIVGRAKETAGRKIRYCVWEQSSEHFVTYLRYNEARSQQVDFVIYQIETLLLRLFLDALVAVLDP